MTETSAPPVSIVEFLTARLDEDAAEVDVGDFLGSDIGARAAERIEADIAAKWAILEFHKQWPVLVEGPPKFDQTDASGLDSVAFKMSRQIAWMTEQEYRSRFGDEPPTTPMMRALASVYSDHPDYDERWRP